MRGNRVSLPTIATLCNSSTEVVALLGTMLFGTRHSKIFPFDTPKNMACELFGFGAESKKFSRHNEKNLVPFFQKIQTKTCAFLVRTDESDVYCGQKNIIHRKIRELAERQAMANRIIEVNHRLNNYKARAKDRLNSE